MENKFIPWTDADFKEIAADKGIQEAWGAENAIHCEELLRESYTAKIPNYITDGPGYADELFVVVHGIPKATAIGRRPDGTFFIDDEA